MNNKIDGDIANYLIEVSALLAHVERDIEDIQWGICFGKPRYAATARKHCRKLLAALRMYDLCLEDNDSNVVKLDPKQGDLSK